MTKWKILVSLSVVGAISLAAGPQLAADYDEQSEVQMTPEQKAEMEKWMQLAAPGEPHQDMAVFAGNWNAAIKTWMEPGKPPIESSATSANKMILGGRYLVQEYKGEAMGMLVEGLGLMAYDNYSHQYESIWIDNTSTMIMTMAGTADGTGKNITMTGSFPNVMTGEEETMKTVQKMIDENTFVFVMYRKGPGGKEFKNMEITYTRAAE
jgi:hypothetical protein